MLIKKAAVIGAGTMGAGIAGQLANAGVRCLLLDIVPPGLAEGETDPKARSRFALEAVKRGAKTKMFLSTADASLVEVGNIEDDLEKIRDCDWIVEVVTENLEVKKDLYSKIAKYRRPGTIVSSNTSGLSLHLLVEGLDEDFRRHFMITHFFNPPRYMYLLELVRGQDTLPEVYETIERFADVRLGKGVVECKDTPNFIGNRIGVFNMATCCQQLLDVGLTVDEVDAITGPALGRPRSASFRLQDLVGIDVSVMVMENVKNLVPDDESVKMFTPAGFLKRLVEEGRLGRKSGAGFYKKVGKDILVLDLDTFEYRPQKKVEFDSLTRAKQGKTTAERIQRLVAGDDRAAEYAWRNVSETLIYSARRVPEISDDIVSVDRAIRWGFNWDLGPFEIWDALGVRETAERMAKDGHEVPPLVEKLLSSGNDSFYGSVGAGKDHRRVVFSPLTLQQEEEPARPGVILLDDSRHRDAPLRSNAAASLWDVGDGVLCLEFHTKMNSIAVETLQAVQEAVDEVEGGDYAGLVIGNQAPNFSAGANLVLLSALAKEKKWDDIAELIRSFHRTVLRTRYSTKPVAAAVHGLTLGGGCEIPLGCCHVQAAAETYMGLVELGVGLIPAGGGTREMACRASESVPSGVAADFLPFLKRSFELMGQAKFSSSAAEARDFGYLTAVDRISMNRDRALADAKRAVRTLAESGYRPPRPRSAVRVAGGPGVAEFRVLLHQYREAGYASDYDVFLAGKLAYVLCGGEIDRENTVTEEYLLDLEREVFLSLCGETKTIERIDYTLKTGKPLRN